ncbi:hypothetical protein SCATT_49270 [Streptantibioticus cattleyicolor NRRL 8057 = DSM 46488]|uniref:Uncharacterized protein n=1 Tax=Streptantibioticus cattleyicolor (strain ATCC 35852 / DSM 46488 / JCM 4925 / NBRC 14057 / NRRL 8057) TaxID=1003195 RepID=G8X0Q8_STREN|nr:hypothetical protein SCATT_49270 [Streptantibioticus cattleyicolor NRRL 8057 = DSM 46488]
MRVHRTFTPPLRGTFTPALRRAEGSRAEGSGPQRVAGGALRRALAVAGDRASCRIGGDRRGAGYGGDRGCGRLRACPPRVGGPLAPRTSTAKDGHADQFRNRPDLRHRG